MTETVEFHRERIAAATTSAGRQEAIRAAALHHHQARVNWLTQPHPTWGDGTPVLPSDQAVFLRQSERYLANPEADSSGLPASYFAQPNG